MSAYNLGDFMRTLALPDVVEQRLLTTLRENLVKIGAKIASHGRYVVPQMAEIGISRDRFDEILLRVDRFNLSRLRHDDGNPILYADDRISVPRCWR